MVTFASKKLFGILCAGSGVCVGSIGHWIFTKRHSQGVVGDPRSKNHNASFWSTDRKCNDNAFGGLCFSSESQADIVNTFQHWLPRVAASTAITPAASSTKPMTRFAVPDMKSLVAYDDFVLHYDRRTRNPHWVFEHLTRERVKASEEAKRERSNFHEDLNIHPLFRATNADYKASGYDRGHLAAAGNHRWSQQAMDQTFSLGNISPQVGKGFNRDAWNTLEMFTRKLTKQFPDVYVITGPLYLPRRDDDGKVYVKYEVIGKNQVAVPTHFFKVIVMVGSQKELEMMSFVMPNQVLPEKIDLRHYFVPLNTIERAAGLLFFDSVPKELFKRINAKEQIS